GLTRAQCSGIQGQWSGAGLTGVSFLKCPNCWRRPGQSRSLHDLASWLPSYSTVVEK
ncbi:hypothetical protein JOQ06_007569, partial [Pogonophryne albipinna]